MKRMNIHQVSVSYVQEQDRMMIRINSKDGDELRAWLTRRLALALLPALNQTANEQMKKIAGPAEPAASLEDQRFQMLTAFQKEASLRKGDFETPYKEPQFQPGASDVIPLAAEPLLLTEVKVTLMTSGQLHLQLSEKLPGKAEARNFQLTMDAQLSNGLLHLLHQSLLSSQWLQAPMMQPDPALEAPPDTEAAELAAELAKPKYLN
jgi:hypothetical protein